jgi:hypothetical protein
VADDEKSKRWSYTRISPEITFTKRGNIFGQYRSATFNRASSIFHIAESPVDFRLSAKRDVAATKAFFRKAIKSQQRCPQTITLDGYAASHRAVRELKDDGLSLRTRSCARRSSWTT